MDAQVACTVGCSIPENMIYLSESEIQKLSSDFHFWDTDLQSSSLNDIQAQLFEMKRACCIFIDKEIKKDSLLDSFKITDGDDFPDIKTLLHIGCFGSTLPVTSCETARSFSGFSALKTSCEAP